MSPKTGSFSHIVKPLDSLFTIESGILFSVDSLSLPFSPVGFAHRQRISEEVGHLWGKVAEGVGFEPTVGVNLRTLSKRVPSSTQPSLLEELSLAKTKPTGKVFLGLLS